MNQIFYRATKEDALELAAKIAKLTNTKTYVYFIASTGNYAVTDDKVTDWSLYHTFNI